MWAEAADVSNWTSLVGLIANAGFAAIVGWYLLTKAIPKMQKEFGDQLQAQRAAYAESDRERRADYKESLAIVVLHCERENSRRDEILTVELAQTGKAIDDLRETLEEFREQLLKGKRGGT